MKHSGAGGVCLAILLLVPSLAVAEADTRLNVGAGAGLLFGGDISQGVGGRGQGNAGILTGVRASWTPLALGEYSLGPEVFVARWVSDFHETDGTLALFGARLQRGEDRSGLYGALRAGRWMERGKAVGQAAFGGFTHLGGSGRVRVGWEVGVSAWREDTVQYFWADLPGQNPRLAPDAREESGMAVVVDTYPFLGPHAWFELAIDL